MVYEVTCTAPVNIAVIKYWGKRDDALILPTNASLSLTLSQDILHSKTSIRGDAKFDSDRLWLNGIEEPVHGKRIERVMTTLRQWRRSIEQQDATLPKLSDAKVHIVSENNFPTAAGLASSASGFAALVFALAQLYDLRVSMNALSSVARMGSGSACRSFFGGYVAWERGEASSGEDSVAVQIATESDWELEALILVVHDGKKHTASTNGMQATVQTSTLSRLRFQEIVPDRMQKMKQAILQKDFDAFAELTMRDSNQFHAICLDTFPPIFYLNDTSKAIIQLVTEYNAMDPHHYKAAYTFDAGPNAVLYTKRPYIKELLQLIKHYFPPPPETPAEAFFNDPYRLQKELEATPLPTLKTKLPIHPPGSIKRVLHVKVGDGPRLLAKGASEQSLINKDGFPHRIRD